MNGIDKFVYNNDGKLTLFSWSPMFIMSELNDNRDVDISKYFMTTTVIENLYDLNDYKGKGKLKLGEVPEYCGASSELVKQQKLNIIRQRLC